jgi:SNF2 family DNA or RNA helicase
MKENDALTYWYLYREMECILDAMYSESAEPAVPKRKYIDNEKRSELPFIEKNYYPAVTLTPEQKKTTNKINILFKNNVNPICALNPGSGKTVIACEMIRRLRNRKAEESPKFLIVHKAINERNPWKDNLKKLKLPYFHFRGREMIKDFTVNENTYILPRDKVITVSYETLLMNIGFFSNFEFELVIFDELYTNAKKITRRCKDLIFLNTNHKLVLSATPVQNSIRDIGLMYIFLNKPNILKNLDEDDDEIDSKILDDCIKEAVASGAVILSGKNKENTITKNEIIISVPLFKETVDYINKHDMENDFRTLQMFLACPDSLSSSFSGAIDQIKCAKVEAVKILVKTIPQDEKIIFFSISRRAVFAYRRILDKLGYNVITFTSLDKGTVLRSKLWNFNNMDAFRIMIATLPKACEGLNLEAANHVVFLDIWWNPQRIFQAMGRIDRPQQKKNIFAYLLCHNRYNPETKQYTIYKQDIKCFNVLTKKIADSKKINPDAKILPLMHEHFLNQETFEKEFTDFIKKFTKDSNPNKELLTKTEYPGGFPPRQHFGHPHDSFY